MSAEKPPQIVQYLVPKDFPPYAIQAAAIAKVTRRGEVLGAMGTSPEQLVRAAELLEIVIPHRAYALGELPAGVLPWTHFLQIVDPDYQGDAREFVIQAPGLPKFEPEAFAEARAPDGVLQWLSEVRTAARHMPGPKPKPKRKRKPRRTR
jgi:hypothetical protein